MCNKYRKNWPYINLGSEDGDCFLPFSIVSGYRFRDGCPFPPKIGHLGLVLGTNLGLWCQHLHGK